VQVEHVEAPALVSDGLGAVETRLRIWLSAWVAFCGPTADEAEDAMISGSSAEMGRAHTTAGWP
jgi:hypothetical protein